MVVIVVVNAKYMPEHFVDFVRRLYVEDQLETQMCVRDVTFQVTDDCPMSCTYCYQGHKGHRKMSKEIGKMGVDLLFKMYDENKGTFINHKTQGLILNFIGGEPLMNIDVIDYICTYFFETCIEKNHPWLKCFRIGLISNGALYFDEKVQDFLKKFSGFVDFSVTIDGPKEIHDSCRVYHNGKGNFDDAYAAMKHFNSTYYENLGTKVTIAPDNLHNLNRIIDFFISEGMRVVNANCVHEAEWNIENAKLFYSELKTMADKMLELNGDVYVSLFSETVGKYMPPEDNQNWCGGNGHMLAFDPDGIAYPCLRYMPSSLGSDQPPIVIGSVEGLWQNEEQKHAQECLNCITRRSQSTDECFNCPVASGCSWCSGWNYQCFGTPDKRCTNICIMHKARVLANVYYFNKLYRMNGSDERFELNLPKEEALKIIDEKEYEMLVELASK